MPANARASATFAPRSGRRARKAELELRQEPFRHALQRSDGARELSGACGLEPVHPLATSATLGRRFAERAGDEPACGEAFEGGIDRAGGERATRATLDELADGDAVALVFGQRHEREENELLEFAEGAR